MKILIVGLGVQGLKRKKLLNDHKVLTVDKVNKKADFKNIKDVPKNNYDAVFLCTPDKVKYSLLKYCIKNRKHILVEKPLWFKRIDQTRG